MICESCPAHTYCWIGGVHKIRFYKSMIFDPSSPLVTHPLYGFLQELLTVSHLAWPLPSPKLRTYFVDATFILSCFESNVDTNLKNVFKLHVWTFLKLDSARRLPEHKVCSRSRSANRWSRPGVRKPEIIVLKWFWAQCLKCLFFISGIWRTAIFLLL